MTLAVLAKHQEVMHQNPTDTQDVRVVDVVEGGDMVEGEVGVEVSLEPMPLVPEVAHKPHLPLPCPVHQRKVVIRTIM